MDTNIQIFLAPHYFNVIPPNERAFVAIRRVAEPVPEAAVLIDRRPNPQDGLPVVLVYDVDIELVITPGTGANPGLQTRVGQIRRTIIREPQLFPESADLYLPSGCTSDWTRWTPDQILEWALLFVRSRRRVTYFKTQMLTWQDLENIVWKEEYERFNMDKCIFCTLRENFNRVVNEYRGYHLKRR